MAPFYQTFPCHTGHQGEKGSGKESEPASVTGYLKTTPTPPNYLLVMKINKGEDHKNHPENLPSQGKKQNKQNKTKKQKPLIMNFTTRQTPKQPANQLSPEATWLRQEDMGDRAELPVCSVSQGDRGRDCGDSCQSLRLKQPQRAAPNPASLIAKVSSQGHSSLLHCHSQR